MTTADFAEVNYWLLGLNIYRAYEISHNVEDNTIGLYALGDSTVASALGEDSAIRNIQFGIMALVAIGLVLL